MLGKAFRYTFLVAGHHSKMFWLGRFHFKKENNHPIFVQAFLFIEASLYKPGRNLILSPY
jgi:hypothetical protein